MKRKSQRFRLTLGGGLVLGGHEKKDGTEEFHFMHVTAIFWIADLARLRKISSAAFDLVRSKPLLEKNMERGM